MEALEREHIIIRGFIERCYFRFADVDPDRDARPAPAFRQAAKPAGDEIRAIVVEAEPVDDRLLFGDAKDARPGIALLGAGSDRSHFGKAEAERLPSAKRHGILIEARGQAHRVGEMDAEDRPLEAPIHPGREMPQKRGRGREAAHRQVMDRFRVRREEQRAEHGFIKRKTHSTSTIQTEGPRRQCGLNRDRQN